MRFSFLEYVVRYPLLNGVFLPCGHELEVFTSAYYVRIQSNLFNQSISRLSTKTFKKLTETVFHIFVLLRFRYFIPFSTNMLL